MDADARAPRRAWIVGGALLLAAVLLELATGSIRTVAPWAAVLSPIAFGAACIVFATGIRRDGSVTARQPVGTVALLALGVWAPAATVVQLAQGAVDASLAAVGGFAIADAVVSFALALVAVVAIGRTRAVSPPWNWAPAWCLAAIAAVRAVDAALAVVPSPDPTVAAPLLALLAALTTAGSALGLGVLAIVLGARPADAPALPAARESSA